MRKVGVSSTLTVFFDGQFWVGVAERVENGALSACRIVFGAEPSNQEVYEFVLANWHRLKFGGRVAQEAPKLARNPKRRQREAARDLAQRGFSTKAQQALAEQRAEAAAEHVAAARAARDSRRQNKFESACEKRKRRHRGK